MSYMVAPEIKDPLYGGPRPFEKTLFNNKELQSLLEHQIGLGLCRAAHVIDEFRTAPAVFRSRQYQIDGTKVNPDRDFDQETTRLARQIAENFTLIGINPHLPSVGLVVAETGEEKIVYTTSATRLQLWKSAHDFRELTENEVRTYSSKIEANVASEKIDGLKKILNEPHHAGGFTRYMGFEAPCEKPLPKSISLSGKPKPRRESSNDPERAINELTRKRDILMLIVRGTPCSEIPELKGEEITRDEATKALAELYGSATTMGLKVADQMKAFALEYGSKDDVAASEEARNQVLKAVAEFWKK